jgi:SAM-dependent methyltransferase
VLVGCGTEVEADFEADDAHDTVSIANRAVAPIATTRCTRTPVTLTKPHDARLTLPGSGLPIVQYACVTTWGAGEYRLMAERLVPVAVAAVRAAEVRPNQRVLDVATGTGNAALVAAELGSQVVAVDFEPALLQIARARASESAVSVRWENADAEALPVSDGWADVVLSVFGVMYAADHERAARELARCVASDGRIVLASWVPGSFMPAMGQVLGEFLPPPAAGSGPPSRWGDPSVLEALFAPTGMHVRAHSTQNLTMMFDNAAHAADFLVRTAGNAIAERERLAEQGRWTDMQAAVQELIEARGQHIDGQHRIDFQYLLATIASAEES